MTGMGIEILAAVPAIAEKMLAKALVKAAWKKARKEWKEHERLKRGITVDAFDRHCFESASRIAESFLSSGIGDSTTGARLLCGLRSALRDAESEASFNAHASLVVAEEIACTQSEYLRAAVDRLRDELTWQERLVLFCLWPFYERPMTYVKGDSVLRFLNSQGVAIDSDDMLLILKRLHRLEYIDGFNDSADLSEAVNLHGRMGEVFADIARRGGFDAEEDVVLESQGEASD